MTTMQSEYCKLCDWATGRAGDGDDSIYMELPHAPSESVGPLCEKCYDLLRLGAGKSAALAEKDKELTRLKREMRAICQTTEKEQKP